MSGLAEQNLPPPKAWVSAKSSQFQAIEVRVYSVFFF